MPECECWIDVGGTFTDCYLRLAGGALRRCKVLSSGCVRGIGALEVSGALVDTSRADDAPDLWRGCTIRCQFDDGEVEARRVLASAGAHLQLQPGSERAGFVRFEIDSGQEAPLLGLRMLLGISREAPFPSLRMRLGTTRGTNALLTRAGATTGVVLTEGFGDLLRIGHQARPRLFDLDIHKPGVLYAEVVEAPERLAADGSVLRPLDIESLTTRLLELRERQVESLAVCLMHSYRNDTHERQIEALAQKMGFQEVSCSSDVAAHMGLVARGRTTVMDAYLNPVLRNYVSGIEKSLGDGSSLRMMTSQGGLIQASAFRGRDCLLSGPAGGVVALAAVWPHVAPAGVIGFDMGGTSTDVSRYDGRYELRTDATVSGVDVSAPMMAIETVAAGGGSVCWFDGAALRVGPDSAGANPGPACYGGGGPLTVTDANVWLGRVPEGALPIPIDRDAVQMRLDALRREVEAEGGAVESLEHLAEALIRVANAAMARPIRSISIARGHDPREDVLVGFGGAAPQHACAVARELGIRRIINHPEGGLLSAYGIGSAAITRAREVMILQPLEAACPALRTASDELTRALEIEMRESECVAGEVDYSVTASLRYRGREGVLVVSLSDDTSLAEAYESEHRRIHGYVDSGVPIEVVSIRVEATVRPSLKASAVRPTGMDSQRVESGKKVWFGGRYHDTRIIDRSALVPGDTIDGPAILREPFSTTVIDPNWRAEAKEDGLLDLVDQREDSTESDDLDDPGTLEVRTHHFAGIAEQMGAMLQRTARSVNVKERLDYSCALFTSDGDLLVNAPHMPVHLGAMAETVRFAMQTHADVAPGDVLISNDPYGGGSHLPDITVMTPVHDADGVMRFWVASRAHHAEIGGMTPGSMPPNSTCLAEEGVLIACRHLVRGGESCMDEIEDLLRSGPYPSRSPDDNMADLRAQVAANRCGARELERLMDRITPITAEAWARRVIDATAARMSRSLAALADGERDFKDHLDDGTPIRVRVVVRGNTASVDFAGTGDVSPGNLNANRAIVTAAVMYVFRLLLGEDIPINQGVLQPISVHVQDGLLSPVAGPDAATSPAVVGGNVETSQRVVDVLLGALGLAAASQGTMNNVVFGSDDFGYYETICGGSGATSQGPGADAVHTHMTNTRITDAEVLEHRYPVRVERFAIRRGSGGRGIHRGGDGVTRALRFLKPVQLSLLTQRRGSFAPYGAAGGRPGALGRQWLERADGEVEPLGGLSHISLAAGDTLVIETPGGGAWGQV